MARTAYLPMPADRYTPCVRTIRLVGIDLTGIAQRMQIRLGGDVPGAPLVDLQSVSNSQAQGLWLKSVAPDELGRLVSTVIVRINETTIEGLPYVGEFGTATLLAYDWQVTISGDKRRLAKGPFPILGDGVTGADGAPVNRPASFTGGRAGETWSAATLTFGEDVVEIVLDGADLIAGYAASADDAALQARANAALADAKAREIAGYAAAVQQAVAGIPTGAQLPLQATSRALAKQISAPVNGYQLYLSEAGREGLFQVAPYDAATISADPLEALAFRSTADPTRMFRRILMSSGMYVLTWWGAKGDGDDDGNGTDNTAAIQACISAVAARGGGKIKVPPGHYCVKAAQQTIGGTLCQIMLPFYTAGDAFNPNITIEGENEPGSYNASSNNIAIFHCTLKTTGGSMFGSRSPNGAENGALTTVTFRNVDLRGERDPGVMMIDATFIPAFFMENYRVTTTQLYNPFTKPTKDVPAIRGPRNNVPLWNNYRNGVHVGFYVGLEAGELFRLDNINFAFCVWALDIVENQHPGVIGRVIATSLDNGIRVKGKCEVSIEMWDTEHASRPSWGGTFGYDVYDPNGYLRSNTDNSARFHCHDGAAITVLGRNLKYTATRPWQSSATAFAPIYPNFGTDTTALSIDELDGTPNTATWRSDVVNVAAPTQGGLAAAWAVSNFYTNKLDYRIGQVAFFYDGGPDSTGVTVSVAKNGALMPALQFNKERQPVLPGGLRQALNDAAAAALTPPVPLGGLYRNGSAVQIRVA
jgi:hypothetical protein